MHVLTHTYQVNNLKINEFHGHSVRNRVDKALDILFVYKSKFVFRLFGAFGPRTWNMLPKDTTESKDYVCLKKLKTTLVFKKVVQKVA